MTQRIWYIGNRAYDLTPWLTRHPGGSDPLLQAEGTDCTELFRSYHLMKDPTALLARFEVQIDPRDPQHVEGMAGSHFTFAEGDFYRTLRDRVQAHLKESGIRPSAGRTFQVLSIAAILIAIGLMFPAFILGSFWGALALGLFRAIAMLGPGHALSHFSLFRRSRWNILLFRLASPFLVSNPAIWSASHIRSHHVHTLTERDLQDNYPVKRIQPVLPHRAWHRGQHVYSWIIYALGMPLWTLQDLVRSTVSLATGKHGTVPFSLAQRIESTLVLALNLFLTVALPFFFMEWWRALLLCLLVTVTSSFLITVTIMMNHEVIDTMDRVVPGERIDWGRHQVLTSHNFSVESTAALLFTGGLNLQIEHHLFPSVHYSRFREITPIVRATCAEFGLPYTTSSSIWEAMAKHQRLLRLHSVPQLAGTPEGQPELAPAAR